MGQHIRFEGQNRRVSSKTFPWNNVELAALLWNKIMNSLSVLPFIKTKLETFSMFFR